MENIGKKNKIKKGLVTLLLPLMLYGGGCAKTQKACEIYQGYYENPNPDDKRIVYVLDSKTKAVRGNRSPRYEFYGDRSFIKTLKIGDKYCFKIKGKRIISYDPYNPEDCKNK